MTKHIGAASYERTETCTGHKLRTLRTRVGALNLLVPRDREGTFSIRLFACYQRNEKAFVLALMEMYLEGVLTRKVAEALCGTSFSKSLVSSLARSLEAEFAAWRGRTPGVNAYPTCSYSPGVLREGQGGKPGGRPGSPDRFGGARRLHPLRLPRPAPCSLHRRRGKRQDRGTLRSPLPQALKPRARHDENGDPNPKPLKLSTGARRHFAEIVDAWARRRWNPASW